MKLRNNKIHAVVIMAMMFSWRVDASMVRVAAQPAAATASSALSAARRAIGNAGPLGQTPATHMSSDATMVDGAQAAIRVAQAVAQEAASESASSWNKYKQKIPNASNLKWATGAGAGAAGAVYVFNKNKEQGLAELNRKQAMKEAKANLSAYEQVLEVVPSAQKVHGLVGFYKYWIDKMNRTEVVQEYRNLVDDVIDAMQTDFDDKWTPGYWNTSKINFQERDSEKASLDEKFAAMGDKLHELEGTVFKYYEGSPVGQASSVKKSWFDTEEPIEKLKSDLVAMKTYLLQVKTHIPIKDRVPLPDFKPVSSKQSVGFLDSKLWKNAAGV